jgi:hypothetical protein
MYNRVTPNKTKNDTKLHFQQQQQQQQQQQEQEHKKD